MTYIAGVGRDQLLLLPEAVDDYVEIDNPVRFIDAFVDGLDLAGDGFARVEAKATGRPGYAPGDLPKLYTYGYLNRFRSSRRLEREAQRNIEVIWLVPQAGLQHHEHLVKDHGFGWGYTWLKPHLQWAGVVAKAPRKGAHRRKRERRPLRGMMLHQDGSRHEWLQGQPALDLIVTLDDATGAIYSAFSSRRRARPRPSGRSRRSFRSTACR